MVSLIDSDKSHSLFKIESPAELDIDDNRTITSDSETSSEGNSFYDKKVQINSGKWSRIENTLFIEGVIKYKCNWKRIQKSIKTRTITQTRSHAQKIFIKIKNKNIIPEDKHINTIQEFFELYSNCSLEKFKQIYNQVVSLANEDNTKIVNSIRKKRKKNLFLVIHNVNREMKQSNNDKFDTLDFLQKSDQTINSTSSFKQEDYFMDDVLGEKDIIEEPKIDNDFKDLNVIFSNM